MRWLLLSVALCLSSSAYGSGSVVARFGGDEFVVLLEEVGETRDEALFVVQAVAEKLRLALELPYRLHGSKAGEHCRFRYISNEATTAVFFACLVDLTHEFFNVGSVGLTTYRRQSERFANRAKKG